MICLGGVVWREALRWVHQRGRFLSALVRPLVWLLVFAAGFRFVLGVSIIPPYRTYIPYEVYIAPGLVGMMLLFNGMQSALSMVYDREMGSMRVLLVSPFPRWYLLACKLLAGVAVSVVQVAMFLAMVLAGMMLGALGLLLSSFIRQLENFAGVMNFVIFPMFFASSALYPLWRMRQASATLYWIAQANPFTHAVELVRFALYLRFDLVAAAAVAGYLVLFMAVAIWGYDPARGVIARRGRPE